MGCCSSNCSAWFGLSCSRRRSGGTSRRAFGSRSARKRHLQPQIDLYGNARRERWRSKQCGRQGRRRRDGRTADTGLSRLPRGSNQRARDSGSSVRDAGPTQHSRADRSLELADRGLGGPRDSRRADDTGDGRSARGAAQGYRGPGSLVGADHRRPLRGQQDAHCDDSRAWLAQGQRRNRHPHDDRNQARREAKLLDQSLGSPAAWRAPGPRSDSFVDQVPVPLCAQPSGPSDERRCGRGPDSHWTPFAETTARRARWRRCDSERDCKAIHRRDQSPPARPGQQDDTQTGDRRGSQLCARCAWLLRSLGAPSPRGGFIRHASEAERGHRPRSCRCAGRGRRSRTVHIEESLWRSAEGLRRDRHARATARGDCAHLRREPDAVHLRTGGRQEGQSGAAPDCGSELRASS